METGPLPPWERLERLLADHYREQGYEVAAPGRLARDPQALWLALRRGDEHLLLECRRSDRQPVTHQEVSALLQAIAREGANGAILITGGSFSTAARAAALRQERLQLVDGNELHLLFNFAIVDALRQALEQAQEPADGDGAPDPAAADAATPLPFYADTAAGIREEDWAAEPGTPAGPAASRRLFVLPLVFAAMALAGWWIYRGVETARQGAAPSGRPSGPAADTPGSAGNGAALQPGPVHEQARQRVIALEGVTSAAWLPNGVLLLGMRDTTRAEQERATRQACAILAAYPDLTGMLVEVQDTGRSGDRGLQVSCL